MSDLWHQQWHVLQLIAKAPIQHKGGFKAQAPTVLLTFTKDFEVGGNGEAISKRDPDDLEGSRGKPGSLVSLLLKACCIGFIVCFPLQVWLDVWLSEREWREVAAVVTIV